MLSDKKCPNCMIFLRQDGERLECTDCGFNYYPNKKLCSEFYAWLSVDPLTKCEGLIAVPHKNGPMPAVSTDLGIVMLFEPSIKRATQAMGLKTKLVLFKRSEVLKEL